MILTILTFFISSSLLKAISFFGELNYLADLFEIIEGRESKVAAHIFIPFVVLDDRFGVDRYCAIVEPNEGLRRLRLSRVPLNKLSLHYIL